MRASSVSKCKTREDRDRSRQIRDARRSNENSSGFVMIGFGAELDQLDEANARVRRRFSRNAGERILQGNFGERMQIRFPARCDLDFPLPKKNRSSFPANGLFRAPGAFAAVWNAA